MDSSGNNASQVFEMPAAGYDENDWSVQSANYQINLRLQKTSDIETKRIQTQCF